MGFAVEMYFDKDSEDKIISVWQELIRNNLPSYMIETKSRPHISLSVYNQLDVNLAEKHLEKFCTENKKIRIHIGYLGTFLTKENVIFVSPVIIEELMRIHTELHKKFSSFQNDEWEYYLPDMWQPHCTMALKIPDEHFTECILTIKKHFLPMEAIIETIGLVEFSPTIPLCEFPLG